MVFRVDKSELKPVRRLPDGRVRADAYLTRTGVFTYGERREWRPPEEVFKSDSLESFAMLPVTLGHPDKPVTPETARDVTRGAVGDNVHRDGNKVRTEIVVFDAEAIAALENGMVELSCGYDVDIDETPGVTPDGERYDVIQREILGNHVAIVDKGRAGPEIRVRMDAPGKKTMNLEEALQAFAEAKVRADAAEKDRDEHKARADQAEADRDKHKARADAAEKERTDAVDAEPAKVRVRVALEVAATPLLDDEYKFNDKSDREVRVDVAKKLGVEIGEDESDDYVRARFDGLVEQHAASGDALGDIRTATEIGRREQKDDAITAVTAAREGMNKSSNDAWKRPEGA